MQFNLFLAVSIATVSVSQVKAEAATTAAIVVQDASPACASAFNKVVTAQLACGLSAIQINLPKAAATLNATQAACLCPTVQAVPQKCVNAGSPDPNTAAWQTFCGSSGVSAENGVDGDGDKGVAGTSKADATGTATATTGGKAQANAAVLNVVSSVAVLVVAGVAAFVL